jgi:hypothetical protein
MKGSASRIGGDESIAQMTDIGENAEGYPEG